MAQRLQWGVSKGHFHVSRQRANTEGISLERFDDRPVSAYPEMNNAGLTRKCRASLRI